jgi:DNA transformation protein
LFFALIGNDTLYLKVDDETRADFETIGMGPFRPFPDSHESMNYYEVAASVLEDVESLEVWALKAVAVARRARARKRKKS